MGDKNTIPAELGRPVDRDSGFIFNQADLLKSCANTAKIGGYLPAECFNFRFPVQVLFSGGVPNSFFGQIIKTFFERSA